MHHIDTQALTFLLASGAVQRFELRPAHRGFGVFVCIAPNDGDKPPKPSMLITTRMKHHRNKSPRVWPSVDSFLTFVRSKTTALPEVRIQFNQRGTSNIKNQQHQHHQHHARCEPVEPA